MFLHKLGFRLAAHAAHFSSGLIALSVLTASANANATDTLTCGIAYGSSPTTTNSVGVAGAGVSSVVGVTSAFGGIGTLFQLNNQAYPNSWVNVLETRSAAGAAWQTSVFLTDPTAGNITFNQAAGNAIAYQWGYHISISSSGSTISSNGTNPIWSDYQSTGAKPLSPCVPSGYMLERGSTYIHGSTVGTAHGNAIAWGSAYTYVSQMAQSWSYWNADQAMYLSRAVARSGNLRLYYGGGSEGLIGPIYPFDSFSDSSHGTCTSVNGSQCNYAKGTHSYAVLVWTIFGLDVGVAIAGLTHENGVRLDKAEYCTNQLDDTCGNLSFHSWLRDGGAATFTNGQVHSYSVNYYVGTIQQLRDLGFPITPHR